jgi:hypothetical protein
MREPIGPENLSYEQQENLSRLQEADLPEALGAALNERGLPLGVYRVELQTITPDPAGGPPDVGHPPPGGCYCGEQDRSGRWIFYCC